MQHGDHVPGKAQRLGDAVTGRVPVFTSGVRVGWLCTGERHFHRWFLTAWICDAWQWVTQRRAA